MKGGHQNRHQWKFKRKNLGPAAAALIAVLSLGGGLLAHDEPGGKPHHIDVPMNPTAAMRAFMEGKLGDTTGPQNLAAAAATDCVDFVAADYDCDNVNLQAFMPLVDIGGNGLNEEANDLWGWTDPESGREFVLIGRTFATAFVEITDPAAPVYIGELRTHGAFGSPWRDIKVYRNHAFIVSEASQHGMQVFDLSANLLNANVANFPITFGETAHYSGFGNAHNIVINEESGFAYGVGTNKCAGGLAMVDIRDPLSPADAGCYSGDGYTHDAQCVTYRGPDPDHQGKEICFASNTDSVTLVDVSDKTAPTVINIFTYTNTHYTHQGWLSPDHGTFYFNDELDELNNAQITETTTRYWNLLDLDVAPDDPSIFEHIGVASIDHNNYVKGRFIYQANYTSGLRILEETAPGILMPAGHFDIMPDTNAAVFAGAWSNYPYYQSGVVVVSGIELGLFILQADIDHVGFAAPHPGAVYVNDGSPIAIAAQATAPGSGVSGVVWQIDDGVEEELTDDGSGSFFTDTWDTVGFADGLYRLTVRMTAADGFVTSSEILVTLGDNSGDPGGPDNLAPSATMITQGATIAEGDRVKLDATASDPDGSVISLAFYDLAPSEAAATKIGDASLGKNGVWSYRWRSKGAAAGDHVITAVAIDDLGASGSSGSITLEVVAGDGGNGSGNGGNGGGNCGKGPHPDCT